MSWVKIYDKKWRIKPVFVSQENSSVLLEHLSEKKKGDVIIEELPDPTTIYFEPNGGWGMRSMNWPNYHFWIGDRTLKLDADMVSELYFSLKLKLNPDFTCGEQGFYYTNSRFVGLILSQAEKDELIPMLVERLDEATHETDKFNEKMDKVFAELAEAGVVQIKPKKSETAN